MYPKCASNHSSSALCCLLKCLGGIKHFTRGATGDLFPHSFQFQTAAHTHHNVKVTNTDRCLFRIQMLWAGFSPRSPPSQWVITAIHLAACPVLHLAVPCCLFWDLNSQKLGFTRQGLLNNSTIINSVANITLKITDSTSQHPFQMPSGFCLVTNSEGALRVGSQKAGCIAEFLGIPDNLSSRIVCIIQHRSGPSGIWYRVYNFLLNVQATETKRSPRKKKSGSLSDEREDWEE